MRYRWAVVSLMVAVFGCKAPFTHNLPPAQQIMHPGPGVDGPGPGVMLMGYEQDPYQGQALTSQVAFVGPEGMIVLWDVSAPGMFDSEALVVPGRYNFPQAALYRLKLTEIPGREGIELYPTLEIGPSTPRIDAYLAHNTIPVQFTEEDFDQVLSGNFVTKVIYLPDAEFQELALAGVETLVSTRLDPGLDPIVEADRRGSIMAIVRIGNKDLEVPGDEATMGDGGVYGASYDPNCDLGGVPPDFLAGVTAPEWGMPMSGTPIGLPGPPHIPLGAPAGLRKHVIRNHTHVHIPRPTRKVAIDVKQSPGMSYPRPAHRAWIHERIHAPWTIFGIPLGGRHQHVAPPVAEDCPPGEEVY